MFLSRQKYGDRAVIDRRQSEERWAPSQACRSVTGRARLAGQLVALLMLLLFWPQGSATGQGQGGSLLVNYAETTEAADGLEVQVHFALLNGEVPDGNARVLQAAVRFADGQTFPAQQIENRPTTPIFIAMALDLSGSMGGLVTAMRNAALSAVDSAPQEARIAIIRFNETISATHFMSREEARRELERLSDLDASGGTKLYDATAEAINRLTEATQAAGGESRRAAIIFTDGYDERIRGEGLQYSRNSFDDVVSLARRPASPVPLHTVGLGDFDPRLRQMASRTGGLSAAAASGNELGGAFGRIMAGLNSQRSMTALTRPAQTGLQTVTLEVEAETGGGRRTLAREFQIEVGRSYAQTVTPTAEAAQEVQGVDFTGIQPDADGQGYRLLLNIADPANIGRIEMHLLREGVTIRTQEFRMGDAPFRFSADGMIVGQQYEVNLYAYDAANRPIVDERGNQVLRRTFRHDGERAGAISLEISSLSLEGSPQELVIAVRVRNGDAIRLFQVELVNRAGLTVERVTHDFRERSELRLPVRQLRTGQGLEPGKHTVRVNGIGASADEILAAASQDFDYVPPAQPGFFVRMINGLRSNPVLLIALAATLALLALFFVIRAWRDRRSGHLGYGWYKGKKPGAATPALINATQLLREDQVNQQVAQGHFGQPDSLLAGMAHQEAAHGQFGAGAALPLAGQAAPRRAHLRVVKSADSFQQGRTVEISRLPFTVGRDEGDLLIQDKRISRPHLQIIFQNGQFMVNDLGSTNGTRVDGQRVNPLHPWPLQPNRPIRIEPGDQTILIFEDTGM